MNHVPDIPAVEESVTHQEANGFSIGAFATALASWLLMLMHPLLGLMAAVVSITLAAFGLRHCRGRWMAITGMVIAIFHIVFLVGGLLLLMIDFT